MESQEIIKQIIKVNFRGIMTPLRIECLMDLIILNQITIIMEAETQVS